MVGDHIWGVNEVNRSLAVWPDPHGKNPICLVSPKEAETSFDYANAMLIASAPQLLEENKALKEQVKEYNKLCEDYLMDAAKLRKANRELLEAFDRIRKNYDNVEDLAGQIAREMYDKHSK